MSSKIKSLDITITDDRGTFSSFFSRVAGEKEDYNFKGLASLRSLLSNEKARIIHTIKTKNPKSIYELAKFVERNFKSVFSDISTLERLGVIDLVKERSGNRERLKPVLIIDTIKIDLKF